MINATQPVGLRFPAPPMPRFPIDLDIFHRAQPGHGDVVTKTAPRSIEGAADAVLKTFDGNGDGAIDIARESRSKTNPDIHYFRMPDRQSIERLARGADLLVGNGDGKATRDELIALMRKFDTGSGAERAGLLGKLGCIHVPATAGDGKLTGSELRNFNASFGIESSGRGSFHGRFPRFPMHPPHHGVGGKITPLPYYPGNNDGPKLEPLPYYPGRDGASKVIPLAQSSQQQDSIA